MSGHSKWDNIKNRKSAQDQKRGKIFSKLSRLITAAVREGNSPDPHSNPRLRIAVDRARAESMPRDNIERAIESATKKKEAIEEFVLEGYGPEGVAVMIEIITDNRQRTVQEIKNIFQKNGGSIAEPGAVSFQFEKKGLIEISGSGEEIMLKLIDQGVEDIEEDVKRGVLRAWVSSGQIEIVSEKLKQVGLPPLISDMVLKAKMTIKMDDPRREKLMVDFLDLLEEHEDVQRIFTNLKYSS